MNGSLQDRIALVTGAGRGIGEAIALAFAREGADLVLAARSRAELDTVAAAVRALGRRALVVPTDMGERDQVLGLADKALAEYGHIDILVSNAAAGGMAGPLREVAAETWRQVQRTNVENPLALVQALLPQMIARQAGAIIFVASIQALKGQLMSGTYAASKAAVVNMTQSLACELGPFGVRVNAIGPGPVDTRMIRDAVGDDAGILGALGSLAPMPGWTQAEDCAGPAVFLASDAARRITGQMLVVDGGLTALSPENFLAL